MFSRSKRFVEPKSCAPPPGAYNPKLPSSAIGPVTFDKSSRANRIIAQAPPVGTYDPYPDSIQSSSKKPPIRSNHSRLGSTNSIGSTSSTTQLRSSFRKTSNTEPSRRRSKSAVNFHMKTKLSSVDVSIMCSQDDLVPDEYKLQIEELQQKLAAKEFELDLKSQNIETLQQQLQNLTSQMAFNVPEKDFESVQMENVQLRKNEEKYHFEINEMLQKLEEKEAHLKLDQQKIESLKFDLKNLKDQFVSSVPKSQMDHIEQINVELLKNKDEILIQLDELKKQLSEKDAEMNQKNVKFQSLTVEMENLSAQLALSIPKGELEASKAENLQLIKIQLEKFRALESELSETKKFTEQMKHEFKKLLETADHKSGTLDKSLINEKATNATLQSTIVKLKEEMETMKIDFLSDKREFVAHIEAIEMSRENFEAELKENLIKMDDCKQKLEERQEKIDWLQDTRLDLEKKLSSLTLTEKNLKTKIDELTENQIAKDADHFKIVQENLDLTETLSKRNMEYETCKTDFESAQNSLDQIKSQLDIQKSQISAHDEEKSTLINFGLQLCSENDSLQEKCSQLQTELDESREKVHSVKQDVETLRQQFAEIQDRYGEMKVCVEKNISRPLDQLEAFKTESLQLREQMERYKTMYEDIERQFMPFKDQLQTFLAERGVLEANEAATGSQLQSLLDQYATLMSHQNTRQKIHHVVKLKNDLVAVQEENKELRKSIAVHKSRVEQLQEKLNKLEGKRRFDPSKAFQPSNKENNTPA